MVAFDTPFLGTLRVRLARYARRLTDGGVYAHGRGKPKWPSIAHPVDGMSNTRGFPWAAAEDLFDQERAPLDVSGFDRPGSAVKCCH